MGNKSKPVAFILYKTTCALVFHFQVCLKAYSKHNNEHRNIVSFEFRNCFKFDENGER